MKSYFSKLRSLAKDTDTEKDILLLALALGPLLCSFFELFPEPFNPGWITIALCGVPIILHAFKAIVTKGDIKADFLVSLALLAAIYINEIFAAAEIAFIMQLGALLEELTVAKAQNDIARLVRLVPPTARLLHNGEASLIPAEQVQVNDVLQVLPGETVPVDGVIISGQTTINQAVMTGESLPVDKTNGDEVFSGTVNQFGAFTMLAAKTGADSSLQRMIRLVQAADAGKAKIVGLADKWATWIVVLALLTAAATWLATGQLIRAVTILVVFCPCALVLATPTAVMAAIGNATRNGFLVREGDALESLAQVRHMVFDKTGTLTYGNLQVISVCSLLPHTEQKQLYFLAAAAESLSEHPLGKAIVKSYNLAHKENLPVPTFFKMLPGLGLQATIEKHSLLLGNEKLLANYNILLSSTAVAKAQPLLEQGATLVYITIDGALAGFIALADTVRATARPLLENLQQLRISTTLLTGDNAAAAHSMAARLGVEQIQANCLPEDKMQYIDKMQQQGQYICMLGDGINDAPALKKAHVGIAMGGIGSDIAIDAADIVLVEDKIEKLPHLLMLSQRMLKTIKINLIFSLTLNFAAIALAVTGMLSPVVGALVHNGGSILVIVNSILLLKWQQKTVAPPQSPAAQAARKVIYS